MKFTPIQPPYSMMKKKFNHYYILDKDKNPVPVDDITTWGRFFEDITNRRVKEDYVNGIQISTVFLGLNHNWGKGFPLLFETMIFGGEYDQYMRRYSTWKQAELGHKRLTELVKKSELNKSNQNT